MPSRLAGSSATAPQTTQPIDVKKTFRTVLGFHSSGDSLANASFITRPSVFQASSNEEASKQRHSEDFSGTTFLHASLSLKRQKPRSERASVTVASIFEPQPDHSFSQASALTKSDAMAKVLNRPEERASRRKQARMEVQDGPWSISVADTPYDKNSFSIYIKTPTHHMTLTRAAGEIVELHHKLQSAHPDLKLPHVPLNPHENGFENGFTEKKRKSSFLHTLSRLASPGPNKRERPRDSKIAAVSLSSKGSFNGVSNNTTSPPSSFQPTPMSSPPRDVEQWDPFSSPPPSATEGGSATCTALAAYLTTLSNETALRQSKAWRRFVRIRTDDLISERAERTVKRVRSDLASHVSGRHAAKSEPREIGRFDAVSGQTNGIDAKHIADHVSALDSDSTPGLLREGILEEEEGESCDNTQEGEERLASSDIRLDMSGIPKPTDNVSRTSLDVVKPLPKEVQASASVSTPVESNVALAARIPRSQSADPDKASRLSRLFRPTPSSAKTDGDESALESESETQGETEVESETIGATMDDDSSVSTSGPRGKNGRSKSHLQKGKPAKKSAKKVVIDDFDMMRVLGKGCAGKVLLVRHKKSESLYALKAITKRHVLAHQELQHTLTEQAVLKRMARETKDPFVVKLWWSFHDKENLFLVMDFHPGGDLATQLARWGRLGRDRARFYAAEIVEGVDGLHGAGVIYRDLKPENILIGGDGHIVLTDFGLSKEFPRRSTAITAPPTPSGSRSDFHAQQPLPYWMKGEERSETWHIGQNDTTSTFCGTAEYLAPEVIQGHSYSYEVDWWSFGTMLYEMLTGITPFWANNHSEMYVRVLQDELKFPDDRVMDQDTKSLIRGLLQRNPALRIKQPRIKRHPYFSMIDWSHVYYKRYIPPYIPPIDPQNASDTQNFDETFLDMEPVIQDEQELAEESDRSGDRTDTDKTDGEDSVRTPAQSRSPSVQPVIPEEDVDLFDGYSFKGRHSVLIDEEEEGEGEEEEEDDDERNILEEIQRANGMSTASPSIEEERESEESGPKTPEARKSVLPDVPESVDTGGEHVAPTAPTDVPADDVCPVIPKVSPESVSSTQGKPKFDKDLPEPIIPKSVIREMPPLPPSPSEDTSSKLPATVASKPNAPTRLPLGRREKSGVAALDKYMSEAVDDDIDNDEDDDWDLIEAPGIEDRNGSKGTSLFARGVVDRYRLAVFRKTSTPARNNQQRNVSGMSFRSDITASEASPSPSPSEKQRRGRNPALTFRRNPKQFLRARSPVPPPSSFSNASGKTLVHSASTSSAGMITPSTSTHNSLAGPSLKSKDSTVSMGSPSSDDLSVNDEVVTRSASAGQSKLGSAESPKPGRQVADGENEKTKGRKLKKYKEGAEKMLSIFASPRP